jgi:hypothetical protein
MPKHAPFIHAGKLKKVTYLRFSGVVKHDTYLFQHTAACSLPELISRTSKFHVTPSVLHPKGFSKLFQNMQCLEVANY